MRRVLSVLALLVALSTSAGAFDFTDIQFWVGTGSKKAGLIIDWKDGKNPASLAWGYRWDGDKKGEDMLAAIVRADPRLYVHVSSSGAYGVALFGTGYDLNDNGFATSPALTFVNGISVGTPNDNRMATDPGDHYREGWWTAGYWSYWLRSSTTSAWTYSGVGMSGRVLEDGCWDGWSWAGASQAAVAPVQPVAAVPPTLAAVPEPAGLAPLFLTVSGMGGLFLRRFRKS